MMSWIFHLEFSHLSSSHVHKEITTNEFASSRIISPIKRNNVAPTVVWRKIAEGLKKVKLKVLPMLSITFY